MPSIALSWSRSTRQELTSRRIRRFRPFNARQSSARHGREWGSISFPSCTRAGNHPPWSVATWAARQKKLAEAKDDERLAQRVAELLAFAFPRLAGQRRTPGPSSAVPTNSTSAASTLTLQHHRTRQIPSLALFCQNEGLGWRAEYY